MTCKIKTEIRKRVKNVGTLPAVCSTLLSRFKDPDLSFHELAEQIKYDPELTAKYAGSNAKGVILTGRGSNGAKGLLLMKNSGTYTIAEHEKTYVVYGMPKAALELKTANDTVPLYLIVKRLCSHK